MISVKGIHTDASGNDVLPYAIIECVAKRNAGDAFIYSNVLQKTDAQGGYDFTLKAGEYAVYAQVNKRSDVEYLGDCTVLPDMSGEHTLEALIEFSEPILPETVLLAKSILEEVRTKHGDVDTWQGEVLQNRQDVGVLAQQVALDKQRVAESANLATEQATLSAENKNEATRQAGIATNKATEATTQQEEATRQAGIATAQATIATDNAGIATAQAQIATEKTGVASTKADIATTQAGIATGKADVATQQAILSGDKASLATGAATTAEEAALRAERAVASLTGAVVEAGNADLSSGVYPAPLLDLNGQARSCFWKVNVGGVVGGEEYGVGDTLVYSVHLTDYYKMDNTESVTSVNGLKGIVELTKTHIGLGLLQNWAVTPAIDDASDEKYATAGAVKKAFDKALEAIGMLADYFTKTEVTNLFLSKTEASNEYLSKTEAQAGYIGYDNQTGVSTATQELTFEHGVKTPSVKVSMAAGDEGRFRLNPVSKEFEGHNGTEWGAIGGDGVQKWVTVTGTPGTPIDLETASNSRFVLPVGESQANLPAPAVNKLLRVAVTSACSPAQRLFLNGKVHGSDEGYTLTSPNEVLVLGCRDVSEGWEIVGGVGLSGGLRPFLEITLLQYDQNGYQSGTVTLPSDLTWNDIERVEIYTTHSNTGLSESYPTSVVPKAQIQANPSTWKVIGGYRDASTNYSCQVTATGTNTAYFERIDTNVSVYISHIVAYTKTRPVLMEYPSPWQSIESIDSSIITLGAQVGSFDNGRAHVRWADAETIELVGHFRVNANISGSDPVFHAPTGFEFICRYLIISRNDNTDEYLDLGSAGANKRVYVIAGGMNTTQWFMVNTLIPVRKI